MAQNHKVILAFEILKLILDGLTLSNKIYKYKNLLFIYGDELIAYGN